MKQGQPDKNSIRVRDVVLRLIAYGVPVGIGLLGFALGWWERLAKAAG